VFAAHPLGDAAGVALSAPLTPSCTTLPIGTSEHNSAAAIEIAIRYANVPESTV